MDIRTMNEVNRRHYADGGQEGLMTGPQQMTGPDTNYKSADGKLDEAQVRLDRIDGLENDLRRDRTMSLEGKQVRLKRLNEMRAEIRSEAMKTGDSREAIETRGREAQAQRDKIGFGGRDMLGEPSTCEGCGGTGAMVQTLDGFRCQDCIGGTVPPTYAPGVIP